jgi:3-deoxy-D-arabino-heptulosonate 7-phosphate (DAHP) synthase
MIKEQIAVVLSGLNYASDMQEEINEYLEKGWYVVSVTAQHVAMGERGTIRGGYFVVLERILNN